MTWWWERYVHPRDLYFHYTGISRFLKSEALEGTEACETSVPVNCFAFALRSGDRVLSWVGSKRDVTWATDTRGYRVSSYRCKVPLGPVQVHFRGTFEGKYTAVLYDTFDGVPVGTAPVKRTPQGLFVTLPAFRHDLAGKCVPVRADIPAARAHKTPLHERFVRLSAASR